MENSIEKPKKNVIGITGLIISIIGFIPSIIPLINIVGIFISLFGGLLSLIGAFGKPRKAALVGLIISTISVIIFLAMYTSIF